MQGAFLAGTYTFSPVFVFIPIRAFLYRIQKLPNPLISTWLPSVKESVIHDKNELTTIVVCFLVSFVLSVI